MDLRQVPGKSPSSTGLQRTFDEISPGIDHDIRDSDLLRCSRHERRAEDDQPPLPHDEANILAVKGADSCSARVEVVGDQIKTVTPYG